MTIVLAVLLFVLVNHVFFVALTNFAITGTTTAAFEFREIATAAFTTRYITAVCLALGVSVVLSLIALLCFATWIGIVIGALVLFYAQIVAYYLLARGCGPYLRTEPNESAPESSLSG